METKELFTSGAGYGAVKANSIPTMIFLAKTGTIYCAFLLSDLSSQQPHCLGESEIDTAPCSMKIPTNTWDSGHPVTVPFPYCYC